MAILTSLPAQVYPGTPSATITFSAAALIADVPTIITGDFWTDSSNWKTVVFNYKDATGSQFSNTSFTVGTNTGTFRVSAKARQNTWTASSIVIYDFDGGHLTIPRASFSTASMFDTLVNAFTPTRYFRMEVTLPSGGGSNIIGLCEVQLRLSGVDTSLVGYALTALQTIQNFAKVNDGTITYGGQRAASVDNAFDFYVDLVTAIPVSHVLIAPSGNLGAVDDTPRFINFYTSTDHVTWTLVKTVNLGNNANGAGTSTDWRSGTLRTVSLA